MFKKVIVWLVVVSILGGGGWYGLNYFMKSGNRDPFTIIPNDAIYIIETNNLTDGWTALSSGAMWKQLMKTEYFKDISKSAKSLDSLINQNESIGLLLKNRKLLISAHMISPKDYDFMFVIDMKKTIKISAVKEILQTLLKSVNYELKYRKIEGDEIMELTDIKTRKTLNLLLVDNLLACSYSATIIEKAIKQKQNANWVDDKNFQKVAGKIGGSSLFNFYFNYTVINKYMRCYLSEESELANSLAKSMYYSAFNINQDNDRITFNGFTNVNDSTSSYIKALLGVSPGKISCYNVMSDRTAVYVSMCFDKFDEFYNNLKEEFKAEKGEQAESYEKKINKVEKLLKVNLQRDFFSWIGNEISYSKLRPSANSKEEDMLVVINSKDIDLAKKGLNTMMEQIRKRTPVKFKTVTYNTYDINYLEIKGFFKMFFGKLFGKLEKPYFTFIKDYVVFSNNPSVLMDVIDDFDKGKTLVNNKDFVDFKDEFESNSNVTVFVETPNVYSYLFNYSNPEKRAGIRKNKEVILCFTQFGFQLVSDGNVFKTRIVSGFNNNYKSDELDKIETSAEDTYNKECEALSFKANITGNDGNYKETYPDGKPKCDGTISNGKLEGLYRSFYESGNVKSSVNYKQGKVEGSASFFYDNDNHTLKAELTFENELIKGEYKEYYENGRLKAKITYKDGKPDGDAFYYYDSGNVKIEGGFKEGEQHGKWKLYNEAGQMYEKQKWKKGEQK